MKTTAPPPTKTSWTIAASNTGGTTRSTCRWSRRRATRFSTAAPWPTSRAGCSPAAARAVRPAARAAHAHAELLPGPARRRRLRGGRARLYVARLREARAVDGEQRPLERAAARECRLGAALHRAATRSHAHPAIRLSVELSRVRLQRSEDSRVLRGRKRRPGLHGNPGPGLGHRVHGRQLQRPRVFYGTARVCAEVYLAGGEVGWSSRVEAAGRVKSRRPDQVNSQASH